MSEPAPARRDVQRSKRGTVRAKPADAAENPRATARAVCWYVRAACDEDIPAIAAAIAELLVELGAKPPDLAAMRAAARAVMDDGDAGVLLVADAEGSLVGVLGASWQTAIHVPGRYALIQDLWVQRSWRSRRIGADLLAALCELASGRQIARIEVGLPRESFATLAATESFYRANGFAPLGSRMRRLLA
jgi:GNAT superfamily N-acetyltransferase